MRVSSFLPVNPGCFSAQIARNFLPTCSVRQVALPCLFIGSALNDAFHVICACMAIDFRLVTYRDTARSNGIGALRIYIRTIRRVLRAHTECRTSYLLVSALEIPYVR